MKRTTRSGAKPDAAKNEPPPAKATKKPVEPPAKKQKETAKVASKKEAEPVANRRVTRTSLSEKTPDKPTKSPAKGKGNPSQEKEKPPPQLEEEEEEEEEHEMELGSAPSPKIAKETRSSPRRPPVSSPKPIEAPEENKTSGDADAKTTKGTPKAFPPSRPRTRRYGKSDRPEAISVESLTGEEEEMLIEVEKQQEAPSSRAAKRKSVTLPPPQPEPPHPLEQETIEAKAKVVQQQQQQQMDVNVDYVEEEEGEQMSPSILAKYSKRQSSALVFQQAGGQHMPQREYTTRLVVEAPPMAHETPFKETPLPGTADEVESYPCKFCPERVFLTSFGLERHTKTMHPDRIEEILQEINRIQEEWKKREKEREKQRERMALAKIRQEALAAAAAREALQGMSHSSQHHDMDNHHQDMDQSPEHKNWAKPQQTYYPAVGEGGVMGNANFESCRICGLLINAEHPTAMENHMRAHKKNDELRNHLVNTYGPEFVARVTCHECQLVFTDERKLISHAEAMHVRRRKYVCKWCGHVCLTMTDLNNHKAEVHGMPVSRARDPEARKHRQLASLAKGRGIPTPIGQSVGNRRASGLQEASKSVPPSKILTSVEELPCRTTCDICHLVMVKPSLLIRHMMRVHNRTNFTATLQVETKGMPSFKIAVDQGKLAWSCCGEDYTDRAAFVMHRRMTHTPKLTPSAGTISTKSMYYEGEHANEASGGGDGQQYVLLLVNEDGSASVQQPGGASSTAAAANLTTTTSADGTQQVVLTPEQLQELGISPEEAENMVLMVDDGSGQMSSADGTQLTLDAETLAQLTAPGNEGQVMMLQGDNGESFQVMMGEDGELRVVQPESQPVPISGETKPGIVHHAGGVNYQEFLNTAHQS